MFRPERMSKATVIFLKSDAERVMDSLNDQGTFHLSLKEVERQSSSDLSDRVQNLVNRLREVIGKVNALAEPGPAAQAPRQESIVIEAPDWPSFISTVEREISSYEGRIKELESALQAEAKVRPIFDLWKAFADGAQITSLKFLSSIKRLKVLVLYNPSDRPTKLEGVLPEPRLKFQVSSEPCIALVVCKLEDAEEIIRATEEIGYSMLMPLEGTPRDYASLPDFLKSYEESLRKSAETNAEGRSFLKSLMPRLLYLSSTLSDAHSVLSIKEKASVEETWGLLEGYVPSKEATSLVGELTKKLNGRLITFIKEEHSSPKVPVTYRYPRFFKLFETITNLYGVPSYNEINPTPILALTFPLLFGLMFGDVGHGIMLVALGLLLHKYTKSMAKIGTFLVVCGVFGAIVGAVLYGEAFGLHIGYNTIFSPAEELMPIFKFAIYIGASQISLGMIISIGNNLIQKKKEDAFFINLPKLILYLILVYIVFTFGLNINVWFTGPIFFIFTPIIFILIGNPVYAMARHGRKEAMGVMGEVGFEVFDTMIRFISNTVSYLRIFAMVMAHVMLTGVFYSISAIVGGGQFGFILSGLIAILGNVFVVLLEGILVLAQDLRLHFYEWFSKFYEDSGVSFAPFKLSLGVPILKK